MTINPRTVFGLPASVSVLTMSALISAPVAGAGDNSARRAEDMTTEGDDNWWLPSCGLSGGSSGGPWIQPLTNGSGQIISVNSWGYISSPGMAGPKLFNTSASCVFNAAALEEFLSNAGDGDAGYSVNCN